MEKRHCNSQVSFARGQRSDLNKENLNLDWTATHELLDHCFIISFSESQCLKDELLISHAMNCYYQLSITNHTNYY